MTVVVETTAIRARVALRAQQAASGVDLWVTLPGLERHRAAAEISNAISRSSGNTPDIWVVLPTTTGTYVWLEDLATWEARIAQLAADLERRGNDGSIAVAPVESWQSLSSEDPYPTAVIAHRMQPPVTEGPFNVVGMPEPRWGVPSPVNDALLQQAAEWVCLPGFNAHIADFAFIPVSKEDAAEILETLLLQGSRRMQLISHSAPGGKIRRSILFETFGQTLWSDLNPDARPTELAERLTNRVVEFAPDLDYAAIHPTFPGTNATHYATTSIWRRNRHLWASFVPDAFGIQVLTTEHLQRAHDLTSWTVDEIDPNRWIVRARDLTSWFAVPDGISLAQERFPSPAVRAQARDDFGAMILTRAAAKANPRPTPGP